MGIYLSEVTPSQALPECLRAHDRTDFHECESNHYATDKSFVFS